jgi:ABC-type sugar transport system permease subunit
MHPEELPNPEKAKPTYRPAGRIALGLALLAPALLCGGGQLVLLTFSTIYASLLRVGPLRTVAPAFVGLANYQRLF